MVDFRFGAGSVQDRSQIFCTSYSKDILKKIYKGHVKRIQEPT